jgi:hypothetical protein
MLYLDARMGGFFFSFTGLGSWVGFCTIACGLVENAASEYAWDVRRERERPLWHGGGGCVIDRDLL